MPVVFIVSHEWDLRGAVRAELREAGVAAMGMETVADVARTIAGGVAPDLIVLDGQYLHDAPTHQALQNLASRLPVFVVDSRQNPAPPVLGAHVLSRPVQVKEIVTKVLARLGAARS
jgi:DNA-binding response OmpR family regulator